jgi:glutamate synthase (NADPH/NADH) small chain
MEEKPNNKINKKFKTKIPEQDPNERINNFKEVALGYREEDALAEASRCLQCKVPKCIDGCPVGIDIKGFINLISNKDYAGALDKIREKNSLPAICGRVCPQEDQCEKKCIVGIRNEPVAIGRLERFVADWCFSRENKENNNKKEAVSFNARGTIKATTARFGEAKKGKVAVVGSGPAGLTCAGELAKMGYKAVIFEALHEAGGVLIYGIPEFRLPKDILRREINFVKELGVEIVLNALIGNTYEINDLFDDGFQAIFIATGAGLPYFMGISGENLNGVYSANEFLTRNNLMKAYKFPDFDTPIKRFKRIAVVGGGNVALDSARTAKRLGAEHVYLIYRRSEVEMPARIEEIAHAKEENIEFLLLTNPIEIVGKNGEVEKIKCIKMQLGEPDSSGRRSPIPIKNSEFEIDAKAVVMAIGQGPNPLLLEKIPGLKLTKKGNIEADPQSCKTSVKGIFAGGDIVSGAATVILAMGAGKNAAVAIDNFINTKVW